MDLFESPKHLLSLNRSRILVVSSHNDISTLEQETTSRSPFPHHVGYSLAEEVFSPFLPGPSGYLLLPQLLPAPYYPPSTCAAGPCPIFILLSRPVRGQSL